MAFPLGQSRSTEEKAKISDGLKQAYANGRREVVYSTERRAAMSEGWRKKFESGWTRTRKYVEGTKFLETNGYVMVWQSTGRPVPEHRLVVEKVLGRPLTKAEVVHHINGNKADNRNSNLLVCSRDYHAYLHQEMSRRYQQMTFGG